MHVISNIGKILCGGEHISIRDGGPLCVLFLFSPEVGTKFLKAYPIIYFPIDLHMGCSSLFWVVPACSWLFGLFWVVPSFSNDANYVQM